MAKQFWVGLLVVALGAAGSASAGLFGGGAATDAELDGIQRMAVVSLLGDSFHGVSIGMTVFQNKAYDASVPAWDMNTEVTGEALRTIGLRGRIPAEALKLGELSVGSLYKKAKDTDVSREGVQTLLALAKEQGNEALLLIQQTDGGENSPFHRPGFGLFRRSAFGMTMQCVYVSFRMVLYRVDTGKVIARAWQEPCTTGRDQWVWKSAWDQYSAEEQKAFQTAVREQFFGIVDMHLDEMKLLKP